MGKFVPYPHPRELTDFLGPDGTPMPGHEASGTILSYAALDALARSKTAHEPCMLVAIGEHVDERRGRRFLELAINPAWLQTRTNYRYVKGERYPVWTCPECGETNRRHRRGCTYPE